MAGETNRLLKLTTEISRRPSQREQDVVVSTGEQVTVGLLALAIQEMKGKARSFLGHQVRILTDSAFANARIRSIDDVKLRESLRSKEIAVVAGFQGIDEHGNITTPVSGVGLARAGWRGGRRAPPCEPGRAAKGFGRMPEQGRAVAVVVRTRAGADGGAGTALAGRRPDVEKTNELLRKSGKLIGAGKV